LEFIKELWTIVTDEHFLKNLITWVGYPGLFLIIFAETGLLVGFFLPGDSLLVTAGLLASTNMPGTTNNPYLNVYILLILLIPAAILGVASGYFIGYKMGPKLYSKESSRFFKKEHLIKTKAFYDKHGGKTIIIAQFMPIIRTFAPTVAGVAQMKYTKFAQFNVIGGITWITSMVLLGYFLGNIPGIEKHIEKVIIVVVFLSISPALYKWLQSKIRNRKKEVEN